MDLVGEFHKVEIDRKLYLVYHNVQYPLPQKDIPKSCGKAAICSGQDLPLQPHFRCPKVRTHSALRGTDFEEKMINFKTSPLSDDTRYNHHVLPLFWCNYREAERFDNCNACKDAKVGTYYYFCVKCDKRYHKECVESPLEINHPSSHFKHSLQLFYSGETNYCICCGDRTAFMVYYCVLCDIYMHVLCAQATKIPYSIDHPKRHDHTLTFFPRQASLTCNVCGLVNKLDFTYVCLMCDFVVHSDCIHNPQTIRISRHHHRMSFVSSLPSAKRSCGVCRREVVRYYGAYVCNECSGYAVHTKCALRKDIWDGKELEGIPEEDDVLYKDVEPFVRIADGIILHFSHGHNLTRVETSRVYDEKKFCQACILQIYEGDFYACVECNFILHEKCANDPRKKLHPLHPHPLQLEVVDGDAFRCTLCGLFSNGFVYWCNHWDCDFQLDIRCALVSEPFTYQGHQHPLFLALDPKEKPMCHVCKSTDDEKLQVLNCIECDFVICFRCATLPYTARYKHDDHYLTFCHGDEASDSDWCELCESKLAIDGGRKGFYKCDDCCTTLYIYCLLGPGQYLKSGGTIKTPKRCDIYS